jgi:hypothetical protein
MTPGTHWTGDWVGPRASPDTEAKRKILCLCQGSNPARPVHSQTLYWLSFSGSLAEMQHKLICIVVVEVNLENVAEVYETE